jgi:hypothetical protein
MFVQTRHLHTSVPEDLPMANGVGTAARLLLDSEIPSTPLSSPAQPDQHPIELEIGQAAALAISAIARGMLDFDQTGMLAPENKDAGGSRIARVVQLRLENDQMNFAAVVRRQGKLELSRHLGVDLFKDETVIDVLLDGLIEIVDRVAKLERELAH